MEVKRTEMEIFRTKKTYYEDLNETKNGSDNFWEIFIALCVVLTLIIVFITCYRYIHGKIIYIICKRFIKFFILHYRYYVLFSLYSYLYTYI